MTPTIVAIVLFAAVLHATWNAVWRSGADRLWTVTVMSYATTIIAIPVAACLPLPPAASWPYLAGSAALQVAYGVILASAYRHGELGQVYPVVRGSVPLVVAVGAFLFAGQHLSAAQLFGVALVSGGIAALAFGRGRAHPKATALAICAGVVVASYVTLDGIGVRLAGNPFTYTAWVCLVYGPLMPLTYRLLRGRFATGVRGREGVKAGVASLVSLLSYGAMVAALSLGPLAPVSALRETSVVFSVVIGRLMLGEAITRRRVFACALVAAGAIIGVLG